MKIETERLLLREMTQADLGALRLILKDDKVMYAYNGAFTDEETQAWLDKQLARYRVFGFGLWAVVLKETGDMIGQCGLTVQPWNGDYKLEVGYLLQRAHWRKGYAMEASRACIDYAFDTLKANEVSSIIRATNDASIRVAIRNGMTLADTWVKFYRGEDMPHVRYAIRRAADGGEDSGMDARRRAFYGVVDARRTIRDFEDAPIPDDVVERIVAAGMKAPTNDHLRDWHFVVVKDKSVVWRLLERVPKTFSDDEVNGILRDWQLRDPCQRRMYKDAIPKQHRMLAEASCVVIPLFQQKTDVLRPESLSHLNGLASIWCCVENMLLAATAEGYACALRIPLGDEGEWARGVLGYPEAYLAPCFIAVGKPKADAARAKQRDVPLTERIHTNRW